MIKRTLDSKVFSDFIYAGIISVKKNQTAKDGRTFHVLEVSDSLSRARIYLWQSTCPYLPKQYVKFKGEVVAGANPFFSCKENEISEISFNDLPQGNSTRRLLFSFNVDIKELSQEVLNFTEAYITHEGFKELIKLISEEKFLSILKPFPAGKSAHHSIGGGLLKHIEEMLELYTSMAGTKTLEGIRHEFVIIGILLHDYYKHKEYIETEEGFSLTENGVLLGHIYQGAHFLHKLIVLHNQRSENKISDLDCQKAVHVLLAHHGQMDWGSPVVPAIPEASILHYIDQISAKLNMFKYSLEGDFNKFLGTTPVK